MSMLTFEEWCEFTDIDSKYQAFHDEYGDAACLLSDYKEFHYGEYVLTFSNKTNTLLPQ